MKNTMNYRFTNESIPKLIFWLATPAVIAQLINAMYSLVDRMFLGRMEEGGTLALSAIGVSFPIIMLISAFAALFGTGGAPLASIKMGEGEHKKAEELLGSCFFMLLMGSILITTVFLLFKSPFLILFGASHETLPFANEFLDIYLFGTLGVLISLGLNPFIAAQGYAKTAMLKVCVGAVVNIILDTIFIYGMNLGIKGAAWATVIAQFISAIWVLGFLTSKRAHLRLRLSNMRINLKQAASVLALGLSPFIMLSTESLIQIVFNTSLARYGGDMYVAAMGIMGTLMQIFGLLLSSFAQGAQPIISYNYGAHNYSRVKSTVSYCSIICATIGLLMWGIAIFIPRLPISLFTNDQELIGLTARLMKIFYLGTCIYGIQLAFQQIFIALGQAKVSIFIAILRKIILLIPLVLFLPNFISPKTDAVIIAEPIADLCAAITCCVLFGVTINKLLNDKSNKILNGLTAPEEGG